jgi:ribonuclease Z
MCKLIVLGSSYAIPDEGHENTHFALVENGRAILIDCAGNPIARLKRANIDLNQLTDIIVTHFHPDHVYGIPLLLMALWLLKRRAGLRVLGLESTVSKMAKMIALFGFEDWPNFFSIEFESIPEKECYLALETEQFRIYSSPVKHWVPTIGLRFEHKKTGKVVAYSCDTAPAASVVQLAKNADILIHEAAGASDGHSSAQQAGRIAAEAKAAALWLIHYPTGEYDYKACIEKAKETYCGKVLLTEDFNEIVFN